MKLITLNTWGGIVYEPFIAFIKEHAATTDIFCFQEVLFGSTPSFTAVHKARSNIFSEIAARLSGFTSFQFLSPTVHYQKEPILFGGGQAIFVKSSLEVRASGGFRCYEKEPPTTTLEGGKMTGNCQWIDLGDGKDTVTVANVHGLWQQNTGKIDTPERLMQSRIIKEFLDGKAGKKILCGDFNLLPDGESIEILEDGMENLIKKYRIQSTRSSFYEKETKFADYILVSPGVAVKDFKVLPDEISDHLPLYLEFE